MMQLEKQREASEMSMQALKEQIEMMSKTSQEHVQDLELQNRKVILELQKELKEMEDLLVHSKRKNDELEAISSMELQKLKHRDSCYQKLLSTHVQALQVWMLFMNIYWMTFSNPKWTYLMDDSSLDF